jgi:CheY-like chemotaxis protein
MDISMPIMDGYDATKAIREYEQTTLGDEGEKAYIVGLTAHSTDGYRDKCFDKGMNDFSKLNYLVY